MAALFAAAGLLLLIGGATKLVWPEPAAEAMDAAGLPSSIKLVRAMAAGEAVLAIAALLTGAPLLAGLVGAIYLAFAGFVVHAMRQSEVQSCGCFGTDDTPPGPVHLVVDLILAAIAFVAAARDIPGLADAISVPYVLAAAVLTYVGYASFTALPRELAARRARPRPKVTRAPDMVSVSAAEHTALVFLSTTCLTCREIWPRVEPLEGSRVIIVTKGSDVENEERVHELAPNGIEVMMSTETWERYGVTLAPAMVVIDGATGEITAASTIRSWEEVSSSSRP